MNILLIEDNPVDAQAICDALSRVQAPRLDVAHVTTLADVSEPGERSPDLVLLDLSLGDSEGLGTIRGALARLGDVPIVVLTGDDSEDLAFEALRAGAQDYLVKGAYSTDTLMRSMRYAVERHGLKASLARADRLAAVGQLSAGVAHEVSNPANFVMGNALSLEQHMERLAKSLGRLGERGVDSQAVAEMLSEVGRMRLLVKESLGGVDRIAKVIRELQDYARLGERRLSLVDINTIVRESAKLVSSSLRHKAKLTLELAEVVRITGDLSKLEQVITNLLVNANHAIGDGSPAHNEVRVRTWMEQRDTPTASVVIAVEDTGSGIRPEQLQHIFEPFFTTKPKERGTGLGLSMAAEIIRLHGGTIVCESVVEQGTRFTIRLPVDSGLTVSTPAPPQPRGVTSRSRGRVLVIDDEPLVLRLFESVVSTQHEVMTAPSAEAALQLLLHDEAFDLVVCDFTMPGMDGPNLHREVSQRAPRLTERFIFCTGGALTPAARATAQRTGNCVLYKPVKPDVLLEAINARLGELA